MPGVIQAMWGGLICKHPGKELKKAVFCHVQSREGISAVLTDVFGLLLYLPPL